MRNTRAEAYNGIVNDTSPWKLGGLTPWQLGRRVWRDMSEQAIMDRAASLSYYFLFALFPTLIFLTSLLGLFQDQRLMDEFLDYVGRLIPGDAFSMLQKTLDEIVRGARGGLLSVGALGTLWAASAGMASIINALNAAYGVRDPRPWWKYRLTAVVLTLLFSLFVMTAMLLLFFGGELGRRLAAWAGLGFAFSAVWSVLRWTIVIGAVLVGIAFVYYLAPAVRQRWQWVTPGSAFALVAWLGVSTGLKFYVANFAKYNAVYGSIGGVVLLLIWLYWSGLVLLIGAEINSQIERAAAERGRRDAKLEGERADPQERRRLAHASRMK